MATIIKIRKHKDRWKLYFDCGHSVLWSGTKPNVGDPIECPAEPIAVTYGPVEHETPEAGKEQHIHQPDNALARRLRVAARGIVGKLYEYDAALRARGMRPLDVRFPAPEER